MLAPLLLAASLAAGPGPAYVPWLPPLAPAVARALPRARLRDQEEEWDEGAPEDESERHPHVLLSGWGGEALAGGGAGRSSSFYAADAAWAFDTIDFGVQYAAYRSLADATRAWTPVFLTRATQRFKTRRGIEAAFSLGFGAGKPSGWVGWYQVALGVRVPLGPLFLGGEIAFEQYDIIRLGGGLGVTF